MKRNLLSIAFVAISALMITAVANDKKDLKDGEHKESCKHHKMDKGQRHARPHFNPFEGINLNDKQKEQLKELKAERKKVFEKNKKERKNQQKAYRQKKRDGHKKHLGEMKKILTQDQYVKYLENIALNRPMMHKHGHHKHNFHKQGHRHPFPGARPNGDIVPMEEPQNTQE